MDLQAAPLPFVPHFQQRLNASQPRLAAGEHAYPDLAEVDVRVDVRDDAAALRFTDRHPFSIGYAIQAGEQRHVVDAADPVWLLPAAAGAYSATVSVRTALDELAPQRLEFRVAESGDEGIWSAL